MSRLISFYAMQARLLWEWRGGPLALVKRLLITVVVATASFALTAAVHRGLSVESVRAAAVAVILMTLFNALIRSVVLALVAPYLTDPDRRRGAGPPGASRFSSSPGGCPGVSVDGIVAALIGSFVYAIINTRPDGDPRGRSRRDVLRAAGPAPAAQAIAPPAEQPGVVIIQIDGLAYPILAGRIRAGSVNTMAAGCASAPTSCRAGRRCCRR